MKGMIFAAGVGSRLKPWTDSHPKALVEVGGKPIIANVIDKFLAHGVTSIIINVHHFASQIVDYVRSAYPEADITFSDETAHLLDTGGGLRKVLPILGNEPVFIHNADIYTDFDIDRMIAAHERSSADVTLLVASRETSRYFLFDNEHSLVGWRNIKTGDEILKADNCDEAEMLAFGGVHIVSPVAYSLLERYASNDTPFSITNFYIDNCRELKIKAFITPQDSAWFDVGRPETLERARAYCAENTQL